MTALILTEDEAMLRDSAAEVLSERAPVSRLRALRDAGQVHDAALWEELIGLGWPAIAFAEDDGGLGLGLSGLGEVLRVAGRGLALTPLASTAAAAVLDPGFGAQEGRVLALAWREQARGGHSGAIATRWDGTALTGRKRDVRDASTAAAFIVSALDGDAVRLFRVHADAVTVVARHRIDWGDHGDVVLDGAAATPLGLGHDALDRALDAMGAAEAAEALGAAREALRLTVAYSKERVQFDRPIGSFQALQHRLVDVFISLELATSAVMQALRVPETHWVALAQAKTSQAFLHAAKEAVQIHGGIGMTDECDVGFYVKRARAYAAEVEGCLGRLRAP